MVKTIKRALRCTEMGAAAVLLVLTQGVAIVNADSPLTHTMSGTVQTVTGTPLVHAGIVLSTGSANYPGCTDTSGNYSISAPAGGYHIFVYASDSRSADGCPDYAPTPDTDTPSNVNITGQSALTSVDLSASDVTRNFTIPTSKLTVAVIDATGTAVTNRHASTTNADMNPHF
jgi:hypothetical protein